jgi:hypothetical protein
MTEVLTVYKIYFLKVFYTIHFYHWLYRFTQIRDFKSVEVTLIPNIEIQATERAIFVKKEIQSHI